MGRPRKGNRHLPKYVTVRGKSYWYASPGIKATRICAVGDTKALHEFLADKMEPAKQVRTINDLFDRYLREELPKLAPATQKNYQLHLGNLREWCGHMHPDELEPRDVGRYLRPDGVKTGLISRNRAIATLSAVYGYAVGMWYVANRNPCLNIKRNKMKRRSRYVTDVEYGIAYEAMPPRVKIAMDLALLTGQRQGDLLALRWDQVTKDGIYFQQGKTGKKLEVAMSPALEEVLGRAKKLVPQLPREYVLRTREGLPYSSFGFQSIWQRRMRAICKAHPSMERFTFHDLRAKSVSDAATLNEAFERAGHASMSMTRGVYDRGIRRVKPLR